MFTKTKSHCKAQLTIIYTVRIELLNTPQAAVIKTQDMWREARQNKWEMELTEKYEI